MRNTKPSLKAKVGFGLFLILVIGFGIGWKSKCPDGSYIDSYLLVGIISKLSGVELCSY